MKTPIVLEDHFDGHLIFYCKGVYYQKNVSFIEGLRKIWAIRCGYEYKEGDKSADEYIANHLLDIIKIVSPSRLDYLYKTIHREINYSYRFPANANSLERIILMYRSQIMDLQVREKVNNRWGWIVKLPNPKQRLFTRILKGKGKYDDYKLINN